MTDENAGVTGLMPRSPETERYYAAFCARQLDPTACAARTWDCWSLGNTPEVADELLGLVLAGRKVGTAGMLWEDQARGWHTPRPGDRTVLLDGAGTPGAIIETTRVDVVPFDAVTDAFARSEGEDFDDHAGWAEVHWRHFSRSAADLPFAPTRRMPVVCHTFRLLHPLTEG